VAQLADRVAAALASVLDQDYGSWEPREPPATYEAFEAYSDGLEAYWRDYMEAAGHFERAAVADPTFHRAALWAAQSYAIAAWLGGGWPILAKAESLIVPLQESRGSLSRYERCHLDFVIAMGREVSTWGNYEAARCMAQAAPGSDNAKWELALSLLRLNRPAEAIELFEELEFDRGAGGVGTAYHMLGDYERELEIARRVRRRFPEMLGSLALEASALAALGRTDDVAAVLDSIRALALTQDAFGWWLILIAEELRAHGHRDQAREVLDQWIQLRPQPLGPVAVALYNAERWEDARRLFEGMAAEVGEDTWLLGWLGLLAARRGDRAEAERISEELQSSGGLFNKHNTDFRARIAAVLGEADEAVTLLRQNFDMGPPADRYLVVHRGIDFESLQGHPAFQEFLRPKG